MWEPSFRVFNFLGIHDITLIRAEGVNRGEKKKQDALASAFQQIDKIMKVESTANE
ncbi:hypothetical protein [Legionella adelaidensis]|uniref:hypothetical protein n=1 Tax=Legionella adelaidensis TaxID=45056 RepID=UPI000B310319|nr:hypothetical protein [Legionella adelaidensis]